MRTRRKQQGKGRWRAGADTCVMKPVVACAEGDMPAQVTANPNRYVSRVVASGSDDARTEQFIRTHFQPLIDANIIVVSIHACTPQFRDVDNNTQEQDTDYATNSNGAGCENLGIQQYVSGMSGDGTTNLITPKFGKNMFTKLGSSFGIVTHQQMFLCLKTAIIAAISMVPDNGPWLIHSDLHLGNVLEIINPTARTIRIGDIEFTLIANDPSGGNKQYAISDWGRVLRISDVNNGQEFYTALTTRFPTGVDKYGRPYDKLSPDIWAWRYMQHPPVLGDKLRKYRSNRAANPATIDDSEKALFRGWTAFTLIYQCFGYRTADGGFTFRQPGKPSTNTLRLLTEILRSTSQADLVVRVNNIAASIGINHFIRMVPPLPVYSDFDFTGL